MSELAEIRGKIYKLKGKKEQIEADIADIQLLLKKKEKYIVNLEKAREIIKIVSRTTQEKIQYHISDIASLALDGIFPEPYKLVLNFVERRNKTECDISFLRNEHIVNPVEDSGFGAVDVASFALRVASWSMSRPRTRPVILLDEPMKHLSDEYQEAASEMIKKVADKLGVQFIIISHKPVLSTFADKVFKVTQKKEVSVIKTLKNNL